MTYPPPGYDDESIVPQHRLKSLLGQFEAELSKIQTVFRQNLPGEFHPAEHDQDFWQLRTAAEELGSDYPFLVERLIADYKHFQDEPSGEKLENLFNDVRNLQLLLVG